MNLESVTIVLVGLCNNGQFFQTLIGTIVFRRDDAGRLEPQLINVQPGEDEGTPDNPFKPEFVLNSKGKYVFSFPVAGGHGVLISLDAESEKYLFRTGLNYGDSGSGGPISNGGPQLVAALDELNGFVTAG